MMRAAIATGIIYFDPFAEVKACSQSNDENSFYVSAESIEKAIAMAPDAQWRFRYKQAQHCGIQR